MRDAMRRCAFTSVLLAAGFFACVTPAQTRPATAQQNSITETGKATPSRAGFTAGLPAASSAHEGNGTSSWSAGRGSFGTGEILPGSGKVSEGQAGSAGTPGSGSSSWIAGRESFGSAAQQDGIWRDKSGIANSRATKKSANDMHVHSALPNSAGAASAFAVRRTSRTQPLGSLAGTQTGGGTYSRSLNGKLKAFRGGRPGHTSTNFAGGWSGGIGTQIDDRAGNDRGAKPRRPGSGAMSSFSSKPPGNESHGGAASSHTGYKPPQQ